jgi:RHS repeat-associated protein
VPAIYLAMEFTGIERDAETGLDYFGARYFSGAQGRFTSPDWSEKPEPVPYADIKDPRTLNLYSYVRNNPLSMADPDGHCCWDELFQVTKDTVFGGAKGIYNEVSRLAATVNEPIDAALRMTGINFQFGAPPIVKASTPGEQSAMTGTAIAAVIVPGGGELKAIRLSEDVSIAVRATAIEKQASIVAKYSDNALIRSAQKAITSIEKHLDILKKASPEQVNSITEDLKKASTRLGSKQYGLNRQSGWRMRQSSRCE